MSVFALLVLFLIFPVLFSLVLVLNILLSAFLVSFLYGADTVDPHFIKCQSLVSYILLVLLPIFLSILFHVLFTACGKVLWSHKYCLSHLNYTKISRAFVTEQVVKNRLKANCNYDVFFFRIKSLRLCIKRNGISGKALNSFFFNVISSPQMFA